MCNGNDGLCRSKGRKGAWHMNGKKAVKAALYISVAGLLLAGTAVPAVYAAGVTAGGMGMESGQEERNILEETEETELAVGNGEERQGDGLTVDRKEEPDGSREENTKSGDVPEGTDKSGISAWVGEKPDEPIDREMETDGSGGKSEKPGDMADEDDESGSPVGEGSGSGVVAGGESDGAAERDGIKTEGGEKIPEEDKYVSGNLPGTDTELEDGLEVPEKFDIVLNPWEMDGKEQIYSEEYEIKNISGAQGTLKLTGIADGEDIDIRPDGDGIRSGDGRKICIEMTINGEERLALLPEGTEYKVVLKEDESLILSFSGEINENAADGWNSESVKVTVVYNWETEDMENLTAKEDKVSDGDAAEEGESTGTDMPAEGKEEEKIPGVGIPGRDDIDGTKEPGVNAFAGEEKEEGKVSGDGDSEEDGSDGVKELGADMATGEDNGEGDVPAGGLPAESIEDEGKNSGTNAPVGDNIEEGEDLVGDMPPEEKGGEEKISGMDMPEQDGGEGDADIPEKEGEVSGTDMSTEDGDGNKDVLENAGSEYIGENKEDGNK